MKKFFKILIPIILIAAILFSLIWYFFAYDRDFTREVLLYCARRFDSQGDHTISSWFYDRAYDLAGDNDLVAIELSEQHKANGNYTQAENTLARALTNHPSTELYAALCRIYVEQDKLLDAAKLLSGITNEEIRADLEARRPAAPTASPEPGFYNQYISVTVTGEGGTLFVNGNGECPSVTDTPYEEPVVLGDGENTIYAITVGDDGLVSPLTIFGYTVGGIIEEVVFADEAIEQKVRQILEVEDDAVLMSNALWDISSFEVPVDAETLQDLKYMLFLEELSMKNAPAGELAVLSSHAHLTSLSITDTPITNEELTVIGSLSKLTKLTLNGCGLSTTEPLSNLTAITHLDLSNNTIRNIQALSAMTGLQEAHLQHNALTDLSSLSSLGALTKLDISYNAVTSLAPLLGLSGLTWLDSSYNNLTTLDPLDPLSSLTYLSLSNNNLSDVSVLAACTSLTQLDVSSNILTDIISLDTLVNLTYFSFAKNQVTEIPTFSEDCMLITIDGSNNLLTSLEPLNGLKNLNNIYMDYNEEIDSVECLKDCPKLIVVNVYGTAVTEVEMLTDQSIIVNFNPVQDGE